MRSEPGVTRNGVFALSPALSACIATWAERFMSSYDELVHEPMSAALTGAGPQRVGDAVLGRGPGRELAGEAHADQLRVEPLPGEPGHGLAAVGPAHADGDHAEAARVGRMRIRPDHEAARERVVLEHHLV